MSRSRPRPGPTALALLTGLAITALAAAGCATKPRYAPNPPSQTAPPPPSAPLAPEPSREAAPAPPSAAAPGSAEDFVINVGDRVYFDYDSHDLRGDAKTLLAAQADWLARYPSVHVRIEGNCDERGSREFNFALGAQRANAVRDYLVARGLSTARVEAISYGKERPVDLGEGDEAMAHNRNAHTAITQGAQ